MATLGQTNPINNMVQGSCWLLLPDVSEESCWPPLFNPNIKYTNSQSPLPWQCV